MRVRNLFRRPGAGQPAAAAEPARERTGHEETARQAEQERDDQLYRDVARQRREHGDDGALRAEWAQRGPAAARELAELDSQVADDRYSAEEARRYHEEQEAEANAARDRVLAQRREHGNDAELRWELAARARETAGICHEQELRTGGGEGWWTEHAQDAARDLGEFDRQLRDELGDDGLEALRTRPADKEIEDDEPDCPF